MPGGELIGVAAQSATQLAGNAMGILGQVLQNKWNKQENKAARGYDYKMWLAQNQYNSPEQQMLRLRRAGLNPNMVYGTGNVVGNTSTSSRPAPYPTRMENIFSNINPINVMGMLSQYQQIKASQANVDNIRKNMEYTDSKINTEGMKQALINANIWNKDADQRLKNKILDYQTSIYEANMRRSQTAAEQAAWNLYNLYPKEIEKIGSQIGLNKAQMDMIKAKLPYEAKNSFYGQKLREQESELKNYQLKRQSSLSPYNLTDAGTDPVSVLLKVILSLLQGQNSNGSW